MESEFGTNYTIRKMNKMNTLVVVSGYFIAFHEGHRTYIEKAFELGSDVIVIVIVNNQKQQLLKYHQTFDTGEIMRKIHKAFPSAIIMESISDDRTVCADLERLTKLHGKLIFLKSGGEYNLENLPEAKVQGIEFVFDGQPKIASSSEILGLNKE